LNFHSHIHGIVSDGCFHEGKNPQEERETLSREQLMMEAIFLGLRQSEGLDIARFERRFGIGFTQRFSPLITELVSAGHP
jgi:oxygen-independent coproporphyrinogen-3 oxidase